MKSLRLQHLFITFILLFPVVSWASSAGMLPVGGVTVVAAGGGGGQNFSEDFTTDPFSTRMTNYTSSVFSQNAGLLTGPAANTNGAAAKYNTATNTINQYAKITVVEAGGGYAGLILRSTGTASDGYYAVEIYGNNLYIGRWDNTGWVADLVNVGAYTLAAGDKLAATITGTGSGTTIRVWTFTAASSDGDAPTAINVWGGVTCDSNTATTYKLVNPSTTYDQTTRKYVGVLTQINGSLTMDTFRGGDTP